MRARASPRAMTEPLDDRGPTKVDARRSGPAGSARGGRVSENDGDVAAMKVALARSSSMPMCSRRTAGMIPTAAPPKEAPCEGHPADLTEAVVRPERRNPPRPYGGVRGFRVQAACPARMARSRGSRARGGRARRTIRTAEARPPKRKRSRPMKAVPNRAAWFTVVRIACARRRPSPFVVSARPRKTVAFRGLRVTPTTTAATRTSTTSPCPASDDQRVEGAGDERDHGDGADQSQRRGRVRPGAGGQSRQEQRHVDERAGESGHLR